MVVTVTMHNPAARHDAARKYSQESGQVGGAIAGGKGGRWVKPWKEGAGITNAHASAWAELGTRKG